MTGVMDSKGAQVAYGTLCSTQLKCLNADLGYKYIRLVL